MTIKNLKIFNGKEKKKLIEKFKMEIIINKKNK